MKVIQNIQNKFQGFIQACKRYPLSVVFLVAIAGLNAYMIQQEADDYTRYLYSFFIGIFLSATAQHVYERFFEKTMQRILLMVGAIILTVLYFYTIGSSVDYDLETTIKTGIIFFALTFAFMWIPTINSKVTFNKSFLATFKSFFTTVLFSVVLYAGIGFILLAVDQLLFSLDYKVNLHCLNLVASLFAPIFFLSGTPLYLSKQDESTQSLEEQADKQEQIEQELMVPKVLELLLSYIVIPLTAIFTIILLVYLLQNITGEFWTNNLLEPMLVSYAITVIIVYFLVSTINTKSAIFFRKIFPKVLVPIVLFQTVSSVLRIQETGLTLGRYYVILFGVFAFIAGIIFSVLPVRKNGWVAVVLIVFSLISILPPVDAFTVSRVSQTNLLKETLVKNNMLEGNKIIPNASIPDEDKIKISQTIDYLASMNYSKEIEWLAPYNQRLNYQFEEVVGFEPVYDESSFSPNQSYYATIDWKGSPLLSIEDYDKMIVFSQYDSPTLSAIDFEVENSTYDIISKNEDNTTNLSLINEQNDTLITIDLQETIDQVAASAQTKNVITLEEATVTTENEEAKMNIVFTSIDIYDNKYNSEFYLFIDIK
ncbi:DUF4153 domain-containing protein [Carnobacterium inhibens]|uniref:DUF4153 domain-containing protein n=2 Tax=Carnobacterium inhibens TaxID=147709 RepID=U5SAS7_9LACT|nr:DUF4153 domain-containing protein [Carnobacterium inhibens]AGY81173.1 hypothetical protein Q783_02450 [Carnobacterium inhibens subsp. gilichinskyi]MBC9826104.1 DUF4153 domain-containing protein [Carnobacterium inhibens]